jgi:hypothetical protein
MTVLGNPSRPRGVSKEMKVWASFAMVACLLVLASDTAEAKYVSETLTIDGPGMDSPGIIESRAAIDRVYAATLVGKQRARIARPAEPGLPTSSSSGSAWVTRTGLGPRRSVRSCIPSPREARLFSLHEGRASTCPTEQFVSARAGMRSRPKY